MSYYRYPCDQTLQALFVCNSLWIIDMSLFAIYYNYALFVLFTALLGKMDVQPFMITTASSPFNFYTFHTVFPGVAPSDSAIVQYDIYQFYDASTNTVLPKPPLSVHSLC